MDKTNLFHQIKDFGLEDLGLHGAGGDALLWGALIAPHALGEELGVDEGPDAALGHDGALGELLQLLVVAQREQDVPRRHALLLEIPEQNRVTYTKRLRIGAKGFSKPGLLNRSLVATKRIQRFWGLISLRPSIQGVPQSSRCFFQSKVLNLCCSTNFVVWSKNL